MVTTTTTAALALPHKDVLAAIQSISDMVTSMDDDIEGLKKKDKLLQAEALAALAAGGISIAGVFLVMKGMKNLAEAVKEIGNLTQSAILEVQKSFEAVDTNTMSDNVAPPAQGPSSEAPDWAKHAMKDDGPITIPDEPIG